MLAFSDHLDISDEIEPNTYSNYYIYRLNKKNYDEFKLYYNSYISYKVKLNIQPNDIIFLYLYDPPNSGFIGIINVKCKEKYNKKNIKVFKDNLMNRVLIKFNYFRAFTIPIKLNEVIPILTENKKGFKSSYSFISTFLKHNMTLTKLYDKGNTLLQTLYDINDNNKHQCSEEDSTNEDSIEDNITDSDISNQDVDEEPLHYNPNKNSEEDNNTENSIEENNDRRGQIPILIIPCSNLILPKDRNQQIEYLRRHLLDCRECRRIDNNEDRSIGRYIDCSHLEFLTVNDESHLFLQTGINSFHNCQRHEPYDILGYPFIRIILINDKKSLNYKDLLLNWIIDK
jgi:hypothetical protein